MKKYKVLNSHPYIKAGTILSQINDSNYKLHDYKQKDKICPDGFGALSYEKTYSAPLVGIWFDSGFLKEVQEHIWTDENMINFVIFHDTTHSSPTDSLNMFKTGMSSKD